MSRIGKLPVEIPSGVEIVLDGGKVSVKGSKGSLEKSFSDVVEFKKEENKVLISTRRSDKGAKAMHGTARAIIANMVKGVSEGWSRTLELVGTGYRADIQGNILNLVVGYSTPVKVEIPEGVNVKVEKLDIILDGADKQVVGEFAARIRKVRSPEPYQGKGIRYKDEVVRRKAGKAAKTGEAA